MLRRAILLTAILLLPNFFLCEGTVSQPQDRSSVEADEYAAYSAFINQKYIPYYSTPKYTLQGALVEDRALDEKGTVVILASTQQEFANVLGVSRYMLQAFLRGETNQDAEETFDDLISKSQRPVRLSNAFDVSMRYQLASNKEWDREKFLERFPHSKGLLSFSRVGFNPTRTKAVFLLAQLDLNNKRNQQPSESTYLVLLNNEDGRWQVNRMWGPERKSFVINLKRCDKASQHTSLPLGSEGFSINGRNGDRCVVEHMSEIEGGYMRTRCRVPVRSGKLTIFESGFDNHVYVFSMDLSKYCDKPVGGNIFFDRIKPPRPQPS